jgi:hypothetical protein
LERRVVWQYLGRLKGGGEIMGEKVMGYVNVKIETHLFS